MASWQPRPDDVQRVFAEQNPWHADGVVPDVLARTVERPLAARLWQRVRSDDPHRFQLILGPRRVGKTTAMYQTVRHLIAAGVDPRCLWWLRLDHPFLLSTPLGDLVRAALSSIPPSVTGPTVLFLDEVVYARDWDLWLKTFHDDRWPVRIVATSSATEALRGRRMESGVGRWSEQYLTPYLFSELLDLVGLATGVAVGSRLAETIAHLPPLLAEPATIEEHRRRFLLLGGFPELLVGGRADALSDDRARLLESQQILRSDAVERAIYKDIPQSFGTVNGMQLERLLYVLAAQIGGVLSPTKVCSELGFTQPTFDRYLSYLTQAFMVFTLSNYATRETAVQKRGRKLYFVDGAVRNAALQRGLAPLEDPAELGLLLENLVAATMHTLSTHSGVRLFYWRDGKYEVDLVYDDPDGPLAVEIGMSPDHSRAGLLAFAERYPRFRGRCYLVAPRIPLVPAGKASSGVGSVPLDAFLVAASRQAAAAQVARLGVTAP